MPAPLQFYSPPVAELTSSALITRNSSSILSLLHRAPKATSIDDVLRYYERAIDNLALLEWRIQERTALAAHYSRIGRDGRAHELLARCEQELAASPGGNERVEKERAGLPIEYARIGDLPRAVALLRMHADSITAEARGNLIGSLAYYAQDALERKDPRFEELRALAAEIDLTQEVPRSDFRAHLSNHRSIVALAVICENSALASQKIIELFPEWKFNHDQNPNWIGSFISDLKTCGMDRLPAVSALVDEMLDRYVAQFPERESGFDKISDLLAWLSGTDIRLLNRAVTKLSESTPIYGHTMEGDRLQHDLERQFEEHPAPALARAISQKIDKDFAAESGRDAAGKFEDYRVMPAIELFCKHGFTDEARDLVLRYGSSEDTIQKLRCSRQVELLRVKIELGIEERTPEALRHAARFLQPDTTYWGEHEYLAQLSRLYFESGSNAHAFGIVDRICQEVTKESDGKRLESNVRQTLPLLKDLNLGYRRLELIESLHKSEYKIEALLDLAFDSLALGSKDPFAAEIARAAFERSCILIEEYGFSRDKDRVRANFEFQCGSIALELGQKNIARRLLDRSSSDEDNHLLRRIALRWLKIGDVVEGLAVLHRIADPAKRAETLRGCASDLLESPHPDLRLAALLLECSDRHQPFLTPSRSLGELIEKLDVRAHYDPPGQILTDGAVFDPAPVSAEPAAVRTRIQDLVCIGLDPDELPSALSEAFRPATLEALALRTAATFKTYEFLRSPEQTISELRGMTAEALMGGLDLSPAGFRYCIEGLMSAEPKETADLLLSSARRIVENPSHPGRRHLLSITTALAKTKSFAGTDFLRTTLGREDLPWRTQRQLIRQLCASGYLDTSTAEWMNEERAARRTLPPASQVEQQRAEIGLLRLIFSRGLLPSGEIIEYVTRDSDGNKLPMGSATLTTAQARLDGLKSFSERFSKCGSQTELLEILTEEKEAPLAYYLLNNGRANFKLINNYDLTKFRQIISGIAAFQLNGNPLDVFIGALSVDDEKRAEVRKNLESGLPPASNGSVSQEFTLLSMVQAKADAANHEAGAALGKSQLGVLIKSVLYRTLLEGTEVSPLLSRLAESASLEERSAIVSEIERAIPGQAEKAEELVLKRMADWKFESVVSIRSMFTDVVVPLQARQLLQKIEEQRLALKHSHEQLLSAIRGENPQQQALSAKISRKERSRTQLTEALAHNPSLAGRIAALDVEVEGLRSELSRVGTAPVSDRYRTLSPTERAEAIEGERRNVRAIAGKHPAGVILSFALDAAGITAPSENDITVAKEIASHLESPLQAAGEGEVRGAGRAVRIGVRYLDKVHDFMSAVRFADSKICCFSSPNYEMQVAGDAPNRDHVAAIVRDPLSFVFMIDEHEDNTSPKSGIVRNAGFCFGMFGLGPEGEPAIFLNGVYSALGNSKEIVEAVLGTIETTVAIPLGIKLIHLTAKHGGAVTAAPQGYRSGTIEGTRLRALQGPRGMAKSVYDDMGTVVNETANYTGYYKFLSESHPAIG